MEHVRNIRSMHVQACQSADVSFNMPGVIALQNFDQPTRKGPASIGTEVAKFDIENVVYARIADLEADGVRPKYNSSAIRGLLAPADKAPYLFALRNEGLAASLDQAIEQRAATFLDKYKYAQDLMEMLKSYLPDVVLQLDGLLVDLKARFEAVGTQLQKEPDLAGAVRTISETISPVIVTATGRLPTDPAPNIEATTIVEIKDATDKDKTVQKQVTQGFTVTTPMIRDGGNWTIPKGNEPVIWTQRVKSQSVTHPLLDLQIAQRQNVIAVLKEEMQNRTVLQKLPTMAASLLAELKAIDLGVRSLQLNYVHTFLTAPLNGRITAIYKDVGENVEPGEPVLRIENDSTVFFVGKLRWRAPLWPGKAMKVKLKSIFEQEGFDKTIDAKVLSVRGHSADNDEWDIVAEAANPEVDGHRLLPLNYQLDPETDLVEFP
jgi:hypothetical protein